MRQTQVENMLRSNEGRIQVLEAKIRELERRTNKDIKFGMEQTTQGSVKEPVVEKVKVGTGTPVKIGSEEGVMTTASNVVKEKDGNKGKDKDSRVE